MDFVNIYVFDIIVNNDAQVDRFLFIEFVCFAILFLNGETERFADFIESFS